MALTAVSLELAAAAFEHLPDGVMVLRDGEVLLANAALRRLVGAPDDLVGAPAPRLPPGREASSVPFPLPATATDGGGTAELVTVHARRTAPSRRERELERLAHLDGLTGLLNQRAFPQALEREVRRAGAAGEPLALIVLDLDHFKRINDVHGHPAGDAVLREVAARMAGAAREGDLLARIGGEEFAWVLPGADAAAAVEAAERLRAAFAATRFPGWLHVTCSLGACALADADGSADVLIERADRALYWAKSCGRDAVLRWTPEVAERMAGALSAAHTGTAAELAEAVVDRGHADRVALLAAGMAERLDWSPRAQARLHLAARLHDVGKALVPGALLDRPGPLSELETRFVGRHAELGASLAAAVLDDEQAAWVRHHHERWDGTGHPSGLTGDAIPEGAQLLAVADAWDAMTRARPYRPALSRAAALAEVGHCAGTHFRPDASMLIRAALSFAATTACAGAGAAE